MASGKPGSTCSEATVEIKIKTLDSQTYTLRVDKCVPVPELKERIATVTGVLSEQQRLICRGRVLKDDQLLSAYHVEDGHTLHMVVRPFQSFSVSDSLPNNNTANDPLLGDFFSQGIRGSSLAVEAFNISGQGDGAFPSFNEEPSSNGLGVSSGQQQPSWQLPVIHDSLTALTHYLSLLRIEFGVHVPEGDGDDLTSSATHGSNVQSSERAGPASLAEVLLSTRQLLIQQLASSLSLQAQQLEDQPNLTDQSARAFLQRSNFRVSGLLMQNLGALLLELGRATMTLRLGETPADAVVNAGPPVFISSLGPNPIMPFSSRSGASYGTTPFGTAEVTRNINVRIRTGAAMMSVNPNEREPNNPHPSRSSGDTNPPLSRSSRSTGRATDVSSRSESAANNQEATEENEGAFLSNVLQQIMPFIAQNAPLRHSASAQQGSASDAGTSSSQEEEETDPSPPRPSKRQKKE